MSDSLSRSHGRERQRIPRIPAREAAQIYETCAHLEESGSNPLAGLRTDGFGSFLARVEESILRLALQPDSWGERTKARLISEIITQLSGVPTTRWPVPEIAEISNVLLPCFLLELGRRNRHIQVEFPRNPCDEEARLALKAGLSHPTHSITKQQLVDLARHTGEELVGLCYFGNQRSRAVVEAELALCSAAGDSGEQTPN